ncbi:MAG: hypothetical protein M0P53_08510, partial [Candidatus Cloacimonas sp.]|nr:hypothetical protein [Candidatus Cloacimonas sp.]
YATVAILVSSRWDYFLFVLLVAGLKPVISMYRSYRNFKLEILLILKSSFLKHNLRDLRNLREKSSVASVAYK